MNGLPRLVRIGLWTAALCACLGACLGAWSAGADRLPEPDAEAIKQADALVEEVYAELLAARSDQDKQAAARVLIMRADQTHDAPAAKYAMYDRAARLAEDAGDIKTANSALDGLETHFATDTTDRRVQVLLAVSRGAKTEAQHAAAAAAALALADRLLDAQRYDEATQLLNRVRTSAFRSKRPELVNAFKELPEKVRIIRAKAAEIAVDQALLDQKPDDPTLNLSVGKFTALYRGDWQRGLAMLAKGSDPSLASAAQRDLAGADTTEAQIELGDAWWAIAEAQGPGVEADAYRARARRWYAAALPQTEGITHGRLVSRLVPTGTVRWGDLSLEPGVRAKLVVGEGQSTDLPVAGTPFWKFTAPPPGAGGRFHVHFEGYLHSPHAVNIQIEARTRIGARMDLKVNGQAAVSGNGDSAAPVQLIAGYNQVSGVITFATSVIEPPDRVPSAGVLLYTEAGEPIPAGPDHWFHEAH